MKDKILNKAAGYIGPMWHPPTIIDEATGKTCLCRDCTVPKEKHLKPAKERPDIPAKHLNSVYQKSNLSTIHIRQLVAEYEMYEKQFKEKVKELKRLKREWEEVAKQLQDNL